MTFVSGLVTTSTQPPHKEDLMTFGAVVFIPFVMLAVSIAAAVQNSAFADVLQDMGENLPGLILP